MKYFETQNEIEQKLSRLTIQNSAVTSLSIMRSCLIALFEGTLSLKKGNPNFHNCSESEVQTISLAFFRNWQDLFPRQMANRKRFVTGLTGIQIALAYTVFHLTKKYNITYQEAFQLLKLLGKHCTWKHDDPLFMHIYDAKKRKVKFHSSTTAIKKTAMTFINMIEKERMVVLDH